MAFLDNSGDIILDAVLTDTGRMRLARGDGTFKISKFALGDDEIDYASYNGNNTSGSAYYDLEILQTPIFEAFTNNTATMKSKLVSLTNNNLLYLPIIQLNTVKYGQGNMAAPTAAGDDDLGYGAGTHIVMVDSDTVQQVSDDNGNELPQGFINGTTTTANHFIRTDQGLNTSEVSADLSIDPELKETQYIIEVDSRLAAIYDTNGDNSVANPSFIDDDSIASYYLTQNVGDYVKDSTRGTISTTATGDKPAVDAGESILGPRGTTLIFSLKAATDLVSSTYLFTTIGSSDTFSGADYYYIDSTIRVTGVTTGYQLDIPVRFLKLDESSE